MKFTVKRSEWLRGEGSGNSYLIRKSDGKKCCIGFVGQQCGISDKTLTGRQDIASFKKSETNNWLPEASLWPAWMKSGDIAAAYEANDDKNSSDRIREAELRGIFVAHGDEIEFVD